MWDSRVIDPGRLRPFATHGRLHTLPDQCVALLAQQRDAWPRLAQGVDSLVQVETKRVELNAWPVVVQFNPGRAVSSLAKVDAASIARRPCFLCAANCPPEQEGLRVGDYMVLTNPAPIVRGHLTIVHQQHVAQAIGPNVGSLLMLARQFGDGWTFFYNGPRCGASAPDHMHFQAAHAGQTPLEREVSRGVCVLEKRLGSGARVSIMTDALAEERRTRCVILVDGRSADDVAAAVKGIIDGLPPGSDGGEPLVNLLAVHRGEEWHVTVFPRAVHRPRCFFADGDGQRLFSPGVMDMAGLVVTVRDVDFRAADAELLAVVYREVSQPVDLCRSVVERLE